MEHTDTLGATNPTVSDAAGRDARWVEAFPEGSERRALDERMVAADGIIHDEEAEKVEDAICLRFGSSPEAVALRVKDPKGVCPRAVLRIARLELNAVLTRLVPEDLVAALLDGVPAMKTKLPPELTPTFVSILQAFFTFADRELGLPHAKKCVEVLDKGMALALEHVLRAEEDWEEEEVEEGAGEDDERGRDEAALWNARAGAALRTIERLWGEAEDGSPRPPMPPARAERNKKKARRRAQKAGRRKNRVRQ